MSDCHLIRPSSATQDRVDTGQIDNDAELSTSDRSLLSPAPDTGFRDTAHRTPQIVHGVAPAKQPQIIRPHHAPHSFAPPAARSGARTRPAGRDARPRCPRECAPPGPQQRCRNFSATAGRGSRFHPPGAWPDSISWAHSERWFGSPRWRTPRCRLNAVTLTQHACARDVAMRYSGRRCCSGARGPSRIGTGTPRSPRTLPAPGVVGATVDDLEPQQPLTETDEHEQQVKREQGLDDRAVASIVDAPDLPL